MLIIEMLENVLASCVRMLLTLLPLRPVLVERIANMTKYTLIGQLINEGIADCYVDAYFMLVDMGEIKESKNLYDKCVKTDRVNLSTEVIKIMNTNYCNNQTRWDRKVGGSSQGG